MSEPLSQERLTEMDDEYARAHASGDPWKMAFVCEQHFLALLTNVERLKSGDFTEEEFQGLCHKVTQDGGPERFCAGCEAYQQKLFTHSPITTLREENERLRRQIDTNDQMRQLLETVATVPCAWVEDGSQYTCRQAERHQACYPCQVKHWLEKNPPVANT